VIIYERGQTQRTKAASEHLKQLLKDSWVVIPVAKAENKDQNTLLVRFLVES
jgi:hypothetical protein